VIEWLADSGFLPRYGFPINLQRTRGHLARKKACRAGSSWSGSRDSNPGPPEPQIRTFPKKFGHGCEDVSDQSPSAHRETPCDPLGPSGAGGRGFRAGRHVARAAQRAGDGALGRPTLRGRSNRPRGSRGATRAADP
jgi:hypothetical protein